jgi:hypothetical protein
VCEFEQTPHVHPSHNRARLGNFSVQLSNFEMGIPVRKDQAYAKASCACLCRIRADDRGWGCGSHKRVGI